MSKTYASPLKRVEIREYTNKLRSFLGYDSKDFISAPKLFDRLSIMFSEIELNFDYRVLPDNDKIFVDKEEAYTDLSTGIIYIKESVMEESCRRLYRRGSFTLIHELGHYFLHYLQSDVKLFRVPDDACVPAYCDPEWQADTFASEFMMTFSECINMTSEEIRKQYRVSRKASEVRYNKVQDEINKK